MEARKPKPGASIIGRLFLVGLQLFWLAQFAQCRLEPPDCRALSPAITRHRNFCCESDNEPFQVRDPVTKPHPRPRPGPWLPTPLPSRPPIHFDGQFKQVELTIDCLSQLDRTIRSAEPQFPMQCCSTVPFRKMCAVAYFSRMKLSAELRRTIPKRDNGCARKRCNRPELVCNFELKETCCNSRNSMGTTTEYYPLDRFIILPPIIRFADCTIQILIEVILGWRELPRACCKLFIFYRVCNKPSTTTTRKPPTTRPTATTTTTRKPTTTTTTRPPKPTKTEPPPETSTTERVT